MNTLGRRPDPRKRHTVERACPHDGTHEVNTKSGECCACRQRHQAAYVKRNAARHKAHVDRYRHANREQVNAVAAAYKRNRYASDPAWAMACLMYGQLIRLARKDGML